MIPIIQHYKKIISLYPHPSGYSCTWQPVSAKFKMLFYLGKMFILLSHKLGFSLSFYPRI